MTQIYRGSMPRVQLLPDNNPKPPYLLSQKEPAFLRPNCALWRPGRAVKPIAIWEMCNRLAWKTSGMLALDGQAELTSEVFTHFKDVPVFSLVCCPWAWMGVWRMHPQTRKTSKETHEHWDCVQRQQEQTILQPLSKHRQERTGGGLCVHPAHPCLCFMSQKGSLWFVYICPSSKSQSKGRSTDDVHGTFL